jgi:hypothetical protein
LGLLDFLIDYVIGLIVRLGRAGVSRNWRLVTARIAGSQFRDNLVWNCPTLHIVYVYQIYGQIFGGEDSKIFFFNIFAERDAERFTRGQTVVVRVHPDQPQRSVLRRADQANLIKAAD